jgi:hypothetical protein
VHRPFLQKVFQGILDPAGYVVNFRGRILFPRSIKLSVVQALADAVLLRRKSCLDVRTSRRSRGDLDLGGVDISSLSTTIDSSSGAPTRRSHNLIYWPTTVATSSVDEKFASSA